MPNLKVVRLSRFPLEYEAAETGVGKVLIARLENATDCALFLQFRVVMADLSLSVPESSQASAVDTSVSLTFQAATGLLSSVVSDGTGKVWWEAQQGTPV